MIRCFISVALFSLSLEAGICPDILAKTARILTTWRTPTDIKNFNSFEYEKWLGFYANKKGKPLSESDKPVTNEQKLAFFDAFRPEDMRLSLSAMSKAQQKELLQILKRIDFKKGMSKAKLSDFFISTYLLSHSTSDSLLSRWKLGNDAFIHRLVEKRFVEEFSRQGLFEATKKFGILLPESRKERIFNAISSYFSKNTKIPKDLVNKILREGFTDSNYARFERQFGKSERTKALWGHLKRSLSLGLFAVFCYQDIEEEEEELKKQAQQISNPITEDVDSTLALTRAVKNEIPGDVNIIEHLLADWLRDYIETHGFPPPEGSEDYKQYEAYKDMLKKEKEL